MSLPEISCRTCLAFRRYGMTTGECRRGRPDVNKEGMAVWPYINDDTEYCLEHVTKEDLEEDDD